MPPIKHSLLGASKAAQWLGCPPSVVWEQSFPEPPSSEAAEEGTLAHAIAEEHLQARTLDWIVMPSSRGSSQPRE